jgi:hypothetical protein
MRAIMEQHPGRITLCAVSGSERAMSGEISGRAARGGAPAPPLEREAQPERRSCTAQHALEPGDEQRQLVEIDASLLQCEAAGCARRCPAAARIGPAHEEHRQRQRVVEHQSLDVGGSGHGDQRVAGHEGAPEAALRRSGIAHEHMFAREAACGLG